MLRLPPKNRSLCLRSRKLEPSELFLGSWVTHAEASSSNGTHADENGRRWRGLEPVRVFRWERTHIRVSHYTTQSTCCWKNQSFPLFFLISYVCVYIRLRTTEFLAKYQLQYLHDVRAFLHFSFSLQCCPVITIYDLRKSEVVYDL